MLSAASTECTTATVVQMKLVLQQLHYGDHFPFGPFEMIKSQVKQNLT